MEKMSSSDIVISKWKVLLIDFDLSCLTILEKMLCTCGYQVTTCQNAKEARVLLKDENKFDIVMVDVYMPHMDAGFEFVNHICQHTHLPVIAMSSNDDEEVIKEGFKAGACDYLVKPIQVENVRHVWRNVCRGQRHSKREQSWSSSMTNNNIIINESNSGHEYHKTSDHNDNKKSTTSSDDNGGEDSKCVDKKKRKLINNNDNDNQQVHKSDYNESRGTKKQRIIWTPELHHKFVAAVNHSGNSKAVPKKILELMNVPGLTRENVASHLQKYRQYQKRVDENSPEQSGHHTMNLMSSKEERIQRVTTATPINNSNIQAHHHHQVIATSSLQVRGGGGFPSQTNELVYGNNGRSETTTTLARQKHLHDHHHRHQMLSFHRPHHQPHHPTIGQLAPPGGLGENSMSATTDINLAINVEHHVEGTNNNNNNNNNVIYHHHRPLASYASYSKIDSKIHVVEAPCHWATFAAMEDNSSVKKEGTTATSFIAREMTSNSSMGAQQCGNYAYDNLLDFGYNDASSSLYIQHLDHNAY